MDSASHHLPNGAMPVVMYTPSTTTPAAVSKISKQTKLMPKVRNGEVERIRFTVGAKLGGTTGGVYACGRSAGRAGRSMGRTGWLRRWFGA
jgi:hypothetical protein